MHLPVSTWILLDIAIYLHVLGMEDIACFPERAWEWATMEDLQTAETMHVATHAVTDGKTAWVRVVRIHMHSITGVWLYTIALAWYKLMQSAAGFYSHK